MCAQDHALTLYATALLPAPRTSEMVYLPPRTRPGCSSPAAGRRDQRGLQVQSLSCSCPRCGKERLQNQLERGRTRASRRPGQATSVHVHARRRLCMPMRRPLSTLPSPPPPFLHPPTPVPGGTAGRPLVLVWDSNGGSSGWRSGALAGTERASSLEFRAAVSDSLPAGKLQRAATQTRHRHRQAPHTVRARLWHGADVTRRLPCLCSAPR